MPRTTMPTNDDVSTEALEIAEVLKKKITRLPTSNKKKAAVNRTFGELFRQHTVVFGVWTEGHNIFVAAVKGRDLVDNVHGPDATVGPFTWTAILCGGAVEARRLAGDFGDFRPDQTLRMLH